MKLNELFIADDTLTDPREIKRWLDEHRIRNYQIRVDSTVDVYDSCDIKNIYEDKIPIKFNMVSAAFLCHQNDNLITFENSPKRVQYFTCAYNGHLESLEGCPSYVERDVTIGYQHEEFTSLHNIHKHIKRANEIAIPVNIKSHILGLMLIKPLSGGILVDTESANPTGDLNLFKAIHILNKHLGTDRDPMLAQRELVKAGLKEFARY